MDETDTKQSRQIEGIKAQLKVLHRKIHTLEIMCGLLAISVILLLMIGVL